MKNLVLILFLFTSLSTSAHKEKWDDNKQNWSPLMLAIYKGETKEFKKLIEKNVDVNYKTNSKNSNWNLTPLDIAIRKNNEIAVSSLLLTNKILHPEKYLMTAAAQNSVEIINLLIKYGANPKETLENGYSVLMMATGFGSQEVFECLLKNGADPNQAKSNGMTVLMLAAYDSKMEKIKLLLKYGAKKDIKDSRGLTALDYFNKYSAIRNVSEEDKKEIKELLKE